MTQGVNHTTAEQFALVGSKEIDTEQFGNCTIQI